MRKKTIQQLTIGSVLSTALATFLSAATASTVVTAEFSGNDCAGYFGSNFDSCAIFVIADGTRHDLSPVIAKLGADGEIETNQQLFPTISGEEFTVTSFDTSNSSGSWSYAPDNAEDPLMRYWVTKSANGFQLSWQVADATAAGACSESTYNLACLTAAEVIYTAEWGTLGQELSHISFYDTGEVPLPATAWLFGSGLLGIAGIARRKKI